MRQPGFLLFASWLAVGHAQNVVDRTGAGAVLAPVTLPPAFAEKLISDAGRADRALPPAAEGARVATKLDVHVSELIDGWPWRPLHHVLGISGFETYFDHPDELFYSLSLALPFLSAKTRVAARAFLERQLRDAPPYRIDGFDRTIGGVRESYSVPEPLRAAGKGRARSAFGVAAFELYVARLGDSADGTAVLQNHWPAICERMKPLLERADTFDGTRRDDGSDRAELLNGDLAGLIAFARLAEHQHDSGTLAAALSHVQQLAQFRVNLERTNPFILEKTHFASKRLHNYALTRYCALTDKVVQCLAGPTGELAAKRLRDFREERNGWYLALGDRVVGGENYTNPLRFGRAMFAGAALIEKLSSEQLLRFVDVPSCRADFYFIEKCALALAGGAP